MFKWMNDCLLRFMPLRSMLVDEQQRRECFKIYVDIWIIVNEVLWWMTKEIMLQNLCRWMDDKWWSALKSVHGYMIEDGSFWNLYK